MWCKIEDGLPKVDGTYCCVTGRNKPMLLYYNTKLKSFKTAAKIKIYNDENLSEKIFSAGDKVLVRDGKEIPAYGPGWTSEMNKYADRVYKVAAVVEFPSSYPATGSQRVILLADRNNNMLMREEACFPWRFDPRGLIKITDPSVEIEAEEE